jgi:hypothetical protein
MMKGSNREFLNFSQVHIGHLPEKIRIPNQANQLTTIYKNYLASSRLIPHFNEFRSKRSYHSPAASLISILQLRWAYEICRLHKDLSDEISCSKKVADGSSVIKPVVKVDRKIVEEKMLSFLIEGIVYYMNQIDLIPLAYRRGFAIRAGRSILFPKREMNYSEIFLDALEGIPSNGERSSEELQRLISEAAEKVLAPLMHAVWEYSAKVNGVLGKSKDELVRERMQERIKEIGSVKKLAMRERKFYEALIGVFGVMVDDLFPVEEAKS